MIARDALTFLRPAAAGFVAAGFVLGLGYFASLRRGLRLAVTRGAWLPYWLLAIARIVAAALFFSFAVRRGVPALLAMFAGFLIARHLAVRAARRIA
jgi:hypothetical protein